MLHITLLEKKAKENNDLSALNNLPTKTTIEKHVFDISTKFDVFVVFFSNEVVDLVCKL